MSSLSLSTTIGPPPPPPSSEVVEAAEDEDEEDEDVGEFEEAGAAEGDQLGQP